MTYLWRHVQPTARQYRLLPLRRAWRHQIQLTSSRTDQQRSMSAARFVRTKKRNLGFARHKAGIATLVATPLLLVLATTEHNDTSSDAKSKWLFVRTSALLAMALYRHGGAGLEQELVEELQRVVIKGDFDVVEMMELLAGVVTAAHPRRNTEEVNAMLRFLVEHDALSLLLEYLAHVKPQDKTDQTHDLVQSVVTLLSVAKQLDDELRAMNSVGQLEIPLVALGAALGHLVDENAIGYVDLLHIGDALVHCQPKTQYSLERRKQHLISFNAPQELSAGLADAIEGFLSLLSPEMPPSMKQFGLWALTTIVHNLDNLSTPLSHHLDALQSLLGPTCATLLLTLPHGNDELQVQAAELVRALLRVAQCHYTPFVHHDTYELWMKQIRYWTTCDHEPKLQYLSASCLRTLSAHPLTRRLLFESSETWTALFQFARQLHEQARLNCQLPQQLQKKRSKRPASRTQQPPPTENPLASDAEDMTHVNNQLLEIQTHLALAFHNVCTSFQSGEIALQACFGSSSTSLLHSKRKLHMSKAFRGALDLNDLPVVGAEEYDASTEFGWIDILTAWSASSRRLIRASSINSLIHLTEQSQPSQQSSDGATDEETSPFRKLQHHILQAWLMSMLQHIRELSDGGEILAVREVEAIAEVSDELTPGNEKVLFNPAVVETGTSALAVLAEGHHEELIRQGIVPLMALLGTTTPQDGNQHIFQTQCARVIANLVASSCLELDQHHRKHFPEVAALELLLPARQRDWQSTWKTFVADHFDVEHLLQQTSSGKRFFRQSQRWGEYEDPMQRSNYYRMVKNMAAYRSLVVTGRLIDDVFCEGVHPIVPRTRIDTNKEDGLAEPSENISSLSDHECLIEAADKELDVVFVHGLRGHPFGTWRTDMGTAIDSDENQIWPDLLLAEDLHHHRIHARLLTIGYEAGMVSWSSPWPSLTLQERARVMLDALYAANVGRNKQPHAIANPVVFVTHSMGGLLVKKMLLVANEQQQEDPHKSAKDNLVNNTRGVVFLAVPHFGSDLAKGVHSPSVRALLQAHPALQDLGRDTDGRLAELNNAFKSFGIDCLSLAEAKSAPMGFGLSAMVVKPDSANPGVGEFHVLENADHMTISKAKTKKDEHYQLMLRSILRWTKPTE